MDGAGASYVDPVINQAVFAQIDLRRHLYGLLNCDFPERFLPTFLHEATHHWCFTSPVGTTLALLRMRACRRATMASAGHGDTDLHWDLLEDVLRQEVAQKLLRPHAEGLACFMELDAIPGHSKVISPPSVMAFANFKGASDDERIRKNPNLHLYSLLYRARHDPQLTQRREDLLASHFDLLQGGHLAGYMIVKGLWCRARGDSERAYDAELFACFMRAYFWDDYGLVDLLLDPSRSEHNAANAISYHFVNRFNQLLEMDWEKQLEIFEASYLESKFETRMAGEIPIGHFKFDGIGVSEETWRSGTQRLESLVAELSPKELRGMKPASPEWIQVMMEELDRERFFARDFLCVGSLDVDVEINDHDRVVAHHGAGAERTSVFDGPSLRSGLRLGPSSGSIEYFLLPRWSARVLCVLRDNKCVFMKIDGELPDTVKEHITRIFKTRSRASRMVADAERNLAKVIAQDSIHFVYDQFHETSDPALEKFAVEMVVCLAGGRVTADCREKLTSGGMLGVLDDDDELLTGLAFLGVACSVSRDRDEIKEWASGQGIELDRVLAGLKKIESAKRFPMIVDAPEWLAALI